VNLLKSLLKKLFGPCAIKCLDNQVLIQPGLEQTIEFLKGSDVTRLIGHHQVDKPILFFRITLASGCFSVGFRLIQDPSLQNSEQFILLEDRALTPLLPIGQNPGFCAFVLHGPGS